MDIQMKYIVERNLEVVYHDPETGMPRLVSFLRDKKFLEGARGEEPWKDGQEVEILGYGGNEKSKIALTFKPYKENKWTWTHWTVSYAS